MQDNNLTLAQGSFFLHVTREPADVIKAQELRYRVFFEERSGKSAANHQARDVDEYDALCDHMIVYDNSGDKVKAIGTYRFLRPEFVAQIGKFYTEAEFDLSKLLTNYKGKVVEVGRSCIDSKYRKGAVIKLLWSGIAMYLDHYDVDLMFGCASFLGSDPAKHALGLSYLHHFYLLDDDLCPKPLDDQAAKFTLIPKEEINKKQAFASLPPLIKGYLRIGGKVGYGAAIDHHVNTTDVCILLKKDDISQRYIDFLSPEDESK